MALKVYYNGNSSNLHKSELWLTRHIWSTYDDSKSPGDYVLFAAPSINMDDNLLVDTDAVLMTPYSIILIEMKSFEGTFKIMDNDSSALLKWLDNNHNWVTDKDADLGCHFSHAPNQLVGNAYNMWKGLLAFHKSKVAGHKMTYNVKYDTCNLHTVKGLVLIGNNLNNENPSKRAVYYDTREKDFSLTSDFKITGTRGLIYTASDVPAEIITGEEGKDNDILNQKSLGKKSFWDVVAVIDANVKAHYGTSIPKYSATDSERNTLVDMFKKNFTDTIAITITDKGACNDAIGLARVNSLEERVKGETLPAPGKSGIDQKTLQTTVSKVLADTIAPLGAFMMQILKNQKEIKDELQIHKQIIATAETIPFREEKARAKLLYSSRNIAMIVMALVLMAGYFELPLSTAQMWLAGGVLMLAWIGGRWLHLTSKFFKGDDIGAAEMDFGKLPGGSSDAWLWLMVGFHALIAGGLVFVYNKWWEHWFLWDVIVIFVTGMLVATVIYIIALLPHKKTPISSTATVLSCRMACASLVHSAVTLLIVWGVVAFGIWACNTVDYIFLSFPKKS